MELHLIRHGQSEANRAHPDILDVRDPALTSPGIRQARKTGEALRGMKFDCLITSPMLRALQTAREISRVLRCPVEVWAELCEAFTHSKSPLTRHEIEAMFPEFDTSQLACSGNGNWWSGVLIKEWGAIRRRAQRVRRRLLKLEAGGLTTNARRSAKSSKNGDRPRKRKDPQPVSELRVGVVLHGGIGCVLIDVLMGFSLSRKGRYALANCSLSELRMNSAVSQLRRLNDVSHLNGR